ncbi:alpha/beta hydrolase [Luteimonas aestuarii]|uniref:Alpha/beta hydrolase n=1 Tax=Luteimonas aestuarii TaxID=453837 RepID=A0A4R5TQ11_9GAMM|nr:alpha/beta fold hydrolase [Luteimonas aestuarii]TDK23344.1 alpha/beta hydrolase [Luteimonas aestuarii]
MRRMFVLLGTALLLAWLGLCLFLFVMQRKLVYFPELTRVEAASTDYALERGDTVLRGWIVNPGQPAAILYFGGNAEAVQANRDDFAQWFPGHTVYLLAYRGYGASDGTPAGPGLLDDALAFFDDVQARHPGQPVSAIGRSLGSGVASHVAAHRPVDRLALVTPFDSLANVAAGHYRWLPVRWLLRDRYPSADNLRGYRNRVLVLHGGNDTIVPRANTEALVAALPVPPEVVEIAAADHNDIGLHPEFAEALTAFLPPPAPPAADAAE